MTQPHLLVRGCFLLALSSACEVHARGPEDYRKDTRAVVETRSSQIQTCYDEALKTDANAAGTVVVHFTVAEDTGTLRDARVLPESTAPAPLGQCVVRALDALTLDPPDQRQADASFVWDFQKP